MVASPMSMPSCSRTLYTSSAVRWRTSVFSNRLRIFSRGSVALRPMVLRSWDCFIATLGRWIGRQGAQAGSTRYHGLTGSSIFDSDGRVGYDIGPEFICKLLSRGQRSDGGKKTYVHSLAIDGASVCVAPDRLLPQAPQDRCAAGQFPGSGGDFEIEARHDALASTFSAGNAAD